MKKVEKRNASFENMIQFYLDRKPNQISSEESVHSVSELEVRFNTQPKDMLHYKTFNKDGYDAVVRQLYAAGFTPLQGDVRGQQMMRIYVDGLKDVRVELAGTDVIQDYCHSNSLQTLLENPKHGKKKGITKIKITSKGAPKDDQGLDVPNVDVHDWRFRVSYKMERDYPLLSPESLQEGYAAKVVGDWKNARKIFRYMNRVRFTHPDWPVFADLSIIKMSKRPSYTLQESGVLDMAPIYEVELEVDNNRCGVGSAYPDAKSLLAVLRKSMRIVFQALQGTSYPVSYGELDKVLKEYLLLVHNGFTDDKLEGSQEELWNGILNKANHGSGSGTSKKTVDWGRYFIGPSSKTLQRDQIRKESGSLGIEAEGTLSVLKGYTATDKADGERKMLYIASTGRIYLIDMNLNISYTGSTISEKALTYTLLDGEHIVLDRNQAFMNLYAAFDIYYRHGSNTRALPFVRRLEEADPVSHPSDSFRLYLLTTVCSRLSFSEGLVIESPECYLKVTCKTFYGTGAAMDHFVAVDSIFEACERASTAIRYDYETDGLILTPMSSGVGGIKSADTIQFKTTWQESFKWKPPEFNTIDFLVRTVRDRNGNEKVEYSNHTGSSIPYKTLTLWCGFNPDRDMKKIWCSYALEDRLPERETEAKIYKPVRFVPSADPYDPEAYLCRVPVIQKTAGKWVMQCGDETFDENTIVEFRYDLEEPEKLWRWKPIRVRHDKTEQLRTSQNNFGNSYDVANTNWYSIHHPVSEAMLFGKEAVPATQDSEDLVYYNLVKDDRIKEKTRGLRDFHNKFVKTLLIRCASTALPVDVANSKFGITLIDLAVGKAGDLYKWTESGVRFVLGVDLASDNLTNPMDGACRRYIDWRSKNRNRPFRAVFLHGDSGKNITNGAAFPVESSHKIFKTLIGKSKDVDAKVALDRFGIASKGFWITSCQFALHYFFENKKVLNEFLRNVAEQTTIGGYFIGTCFDGQTVFDKLKNAALPIEEKYNHPKTGEPTTLFRIEKKFTQNQFEPDESSIGYRIDVYQETINKVFPEYLVHFDYLVKILSMYGFDLADPSTIRSAGMESNTGMFEDLYGALKNNKDPERYGKASEMTQSEKNVSFMNRYFIFQKKRAIDTTLVFNHNMAISSKQTANAIAESLLSSDSDSEQKISSENKVSISNVKKSDRKLEAFDIAETSSDEEEDDEPPVIQLKPSFKKSLQENDSDQSNDLGIEIKPGEKQLSMKPNRSDSK